jgi:hypothetical protein
MTTPARQTGIKTVDKRNPINPEKTRSLFFIIASTSLSSHFTVDKNYMKREVGVLKNLYTCLREAASAKAGRHF